MMMMLYHDNIELKLPFVGSETEPERCYQTNKKCYNDDR